jgi:hypothetical protein
LQDQLLVQPVDFLGDLSVPMCWHAYRSSGVGAEFDDLVRLAAPGSRQRLVGLNMSFPSSSRPFSITNLLGRFH